MRLEVTRKADLATRAIVVLGVTGRRMKSAELAKQLETTPGFIPHVLSPLVARGWVRSDPGPTGGYTAVTPLAEISVLSVIECIDGPSESGMCVVEGRPCQPEDPCALHGAWTRARAALLAELEATPVSEFARLCECGLVNTTAVSGG